MLTCPPYLFLVGSLKKIIELMFTQTVFCQRGIPILYKIIQRTICLVRTGLWPSAHVTSIVVGKPWFRFIRPHFNEVLI